MSLKAKLVSTIAAFVMVLALMVVGVLAATNSTINMSGSISFTAQDIVGTVVLTGDGISDHKEEFDANKGKETCTWDDLNLSYTSKSDNTIELTLVITNNATDGRDIRVTFTKAPAVTNAPAVTVNSVYGAESTTVSDSTTFDVENGKPVTVRITFTCSDFNNNIAGTWSSVFTLANVAAAAAD